METKKTANYENRKYNLLWYFDQILTGNQREKAFDELPKVLGISYVQVNRYVYASHGDAIEISATKLFKIAEYLEKKIGEPVSMEMLINTEQTDGQTAQGEILN
jgi:hypothetical protein